MEPTNLVVSESSNDEFCNLRVTTMVLIITLDGEVDDATLYHLLPILIIPLPQPKRRSSKYKIPFVGFSGGIFSVRKEKDTRGIIRSGASAFKNTITIDMAISVKNVCIKLSKSKIHITGAKSESMGYEVRDLLVNHIKTIQGNLDYIQDHPEETKITLEWIAQATKPLDPEVTTGITLPSCLPETIDKRIARFLLPFWHDFTEQKDFLAKITWITTIKSIYQGNLEITSINKAMVNYNYSLGYEIDRNKLRDHMNHRDGFYARYINSIEHSVSLELPYKSYIVRTSKKKFKKVVKSHTFLVHKSGKVTQTGPGGEDIRSAYYKFINNMREIRHLVAY